jgi:death-on-curing protein
MSAHKYLSVEQVIAIHQEVVEASGGSAGLRDRGILESAVAQPLMSFGGQDLYPSLAEKAAALGFSLVSNHPFVDGNKRIGWVTMRTFLAINAFDLETEIDNAEATVLKLAAGELSREDWTDWVCQHIVKFPP